MGTEASTGTDLPFALISTAELRITRAISERHHARVTSQLFGPEVFTSVFLNGCLVSHGLYQATISTVQQYPPTNNYTLHLHDQITTIQDSNVPQYHTATIDTVVQYSHAHNTIHVSSLQQYIHRSAPISHTFLPALRSTLAARDMYCTPGTSMNCTDISTLYFLCSPIYIIRTSMVTCCDYIFLCGIPTSGTSRNGIFFCEARAPMDKDHRH